MDERTLKFWDKWIGRGMKLIVLWIVIGILTGLFFMNKFFDAQKELSKNVQERSQAFDQAFDRMKENRESLEKSFKEQSQKNSELIDQRRAAIDNRFNDMAQEMFKNFGQVNSNINDEKNKLAQPLSQESKKDENGATQADVLTDQENAFLALVESSPAEDRASLCEDLDSNPVYHNIRKDKILACEKINKENVQAGSSASVEPNNALHEQESQEKAE